MSVAVYVMPLSTWLSGRFRTLWDSGASAPRSQRSPEAVARACREFGDVLDRMLTFRPGEEEGPIRSATVFSLEGFSLPFELAQQWAFRLKLPRLCALEPPQIWLPEKFEPVFRLAAPWKPDSEVTVASSAGVIQDLDRLLAAILKEERLDLDETERVARRLRESAELGLNHRAPVIVEI